MADQRIQATENLIGANHPTLTDTLNRLTLVDHNTDGTHKKIGNVVMVSSYANLPAAITAIGSTECVLMLDADIACGADATIPSTTELMGVNGSVITVASGKTLTVNGIITARSQIFAGSGSVTLSGSGKRKVWPEWFGAIGDGSTDDTAAFQKCVNTGAPIILGPGKSYVVENIDVLIDNIHIIGTRPGNLWASTSGLGSALKAKSGANYILRYGDSVSPAVNGHIIEGVTFLGDAASQGAATDSYGVLLEYGTQVTIRDCTFDKCGGAVVPVNADRLRLDNCYFFNNYAALYYDSSVITTANVACSGVTITHCHTRTNVYGVFFSGERTDFDMTFIGGYWGGNGYNQTGVNDVYVTGAARSLRFYGVNFENGTDSPASAKPEIVKIGMVHTGTHIGLETVIFNGCTFFDNNITANASKLITVVDSTSTTYPSILRVIFDGNIIQNLASSPFNIPDTASSVRYGIYQHNETRGSGYYPTQAAFRVSANSVSSYTLAGAGLYTPILTQLLLNPTSGYSMNTYESGSILVNTGSVSGKTYNLPSVSASDIGVTFEFVNTAAQNIVVFPYTGGRILGTSAIDKSVATPSSIPGGFKLVCTGVEQWAVISSTGTLIYG